MKSNVFNEILKKLKKEEAKKKWSQIVKDERNKRRREERAKSDEEKDLESLDRALEFEDIILSGNNMSDEMVIAWTISKDIQNFVSTTLLEDIRTKLPRSDFAGIRGPIKGKKERTNNLRNSLAFSNKEGTKFSRMTLELDTSKIYYADIINDYSRFITYGYWEKIGQDAYEQLYQHLKKLEPILGIEVTKGRRR